MKNVPPRGRGMRGANDNYRGWAEVHMPSDEYLLSPDWVSDLAFDLAEVCFNKKISRRRVIDWMADAIYSFDGDVFNADGSHWDISDVEVDDPFGADLSFRWVSSFLRIVHRRPRQRMQQRVLGRLRLIYLATCIYGLTDPDCTPYFTPRRHG